MDNQHKISGCEACSTSTTGACAAHTTYLKWDFKECLDNCVLIPAGVRHFRVLNLGGPFPGPITINGKKLSPSGNAYEPPQFPYDYCNNQEIRHPEITVCNTGSKQYIRVEWWW